MIRELPSLTALQAFEAALRHQSFTRAGGMAPLSIKGRIRRRSRSSAPEINRLVPDSPRPSSLPTVLPLSSARWAFATSASGYVDRTSDYPLFVSSVEDRLHTWGCGLLQNGATWRFRCATDMSSRDGGRPWRG